MLCLFSSAKNAFIRLAHTIEHTITQNTHHGTHHHHKITTRSQGITQHKHHTLDLLAKLFDTNTETDNKTSKKDKKYNTDKRLSSFTYNTLKIAAASSKKSNYYYLIRAYTSIRWSPFKPPQV